MKKKPEKEEKFEIVTRYHIYSLSSEGHLSKPTEAWSREEVFSEYDSQEGALEAINGAYPTEWVSFYILPCTIRRPVY